MWWHDGTNFRQVTKNNGVDLEFYDEFFVGGITYHTNRRNQIEVRDPDLRSFFFR